ncbi:LytTR family DNA-binding domain-containing protein [Spirosoma linguale]|uniref:Response regulator receiver protein n=1 Tax=Spirosoma linguale (strain ATCC 33905 / DSM 74 / LMG 10896 / Claus 1) TaxID=504472 RepID=D2QSC9_SPILD|nr:response regulator receiver protein [Spirosoma linguale DSM 74]
MVRFLNQPYPIDYSAGAQLRKATLIGLFVGLFLLVFQPFGLNSWETPNKVLKILGFGAVTFAVTAFNFIILRRLFPRLYVEEEWTVGREIVALMINIMLIAIANRFYLGWLLDVGEHSSISWAGMILVTFLIGLFPVTGLVFVSYITRLKKYSQAAASLPIHVHNEVTTLARTAPVGPATEPVNATVTLVADNEKDSVSLDAEDLLFVESSDNYCTVTYLKNKQVAKPLLRSSLSRLEKQITQPYIVRCHRSYIVNLNRVERVTGNAQGYKLHLLSGQFIVPVSRQYNETLIAELKAL